MTLFCNLFMERPSYFGVTRFMKGFAVLQFSQFAVIVILIC